MREGPLKSYIAAVMDADGVTYDYVCMARSRSHAEDEARESVSQWGATLVGITPAVDHKKGASRRRLLLVAGSTLAVSGITIIAMMVIGLRLEGAL